MRLQHLVPSLAALALLVAAPARAEKLTEQHLQKLAAESDRMCRQSIPQLPGDRASYDVDAICRCADREVQQGLRAMDLDNGNKPSAADLKKFEQNVFHAGLVCTQPYYSKAIGKATSSQCFANMRPRPDMMGKTDEQLRQLCDCTGEKFGQRTDMSTANTATPEQLQAQAAANLQQSLAECSARQAP